MFILCIFDKNCSENPMKRDRKETKTEQQAGGECKVLEMKFRGSRIRTTPYKTESNTIP